MQARQPGEFAIILSIHKSAFPSPPPRGEAGRPPGAISNLQDHSLHNRPKNLSKRRPTPFTAFAPILHWRAVSLNIIDPQAAAA